MRESDNVWIFSRLMLQGIVRVAVHWATERARGNVLLPTDSVAELHEDNISVTVMDILHQKHPAAQTPKASALVMCDTLPLLEDVEITDSHILLVVHCVQGGAGPGHCDAGHWMFYFVLVHTTQDYAMLLLLLHGNC